MNADPIRIHTRFISGLTLGSALGWFIFQQLERFFELEIVCRRFRCRSGRGVALVVSLVRLVDGVVIVAGQIVGINSLRNFGSLHFDAWRHSGMGTIFAQECLAIRARPFDCGEQETVATPLCEQLLLGAGAKALLANHLPTVALDQG